MRARRRTYAFTLLEVMVAIAILGLGLTAILSAQAGSFTSSNHARNLSLATSLARCKMSEVEEKLLREGFSENDERDAGSCCNDEDGPMRCAWSIQKPELPEPKLGELDLDTSLDTGGGLGPLGALGKLEQGTESLPTDARVGDIAQSLATGSGDAQSAASAVGGVDGIAQMIMDMIYPDLKTLLEASTRRITVDLTWKEGEIEKHFQLVQWVSNPRLPPIQEEGEEETGAIDTASPSTKTSSKGTR